MPEQKSKQHEPEVSAAQGEEQGTEQSKDERTAQQAQGDQSEQAQANGASQSADAGSAPTAPDFAAMLNALGELEADADAKASLGQQLQDARVWLEQAQKGWQEREREAQDLYLRAQAEMQNVRRSTEREVQKAYRYGTEALVVELLGTLDNLARALDSLSEAGVERQNLEGLELTQKSLLGTLEKSGVTEVDPQGEIFDPQKHEALTTMPSDEIEPGRVVQVVQKGYLLSDKVIRPARVIISAEKPQATEQQADGAD